jgi:MFS family permease
MVDTGAQTSVDEVIVVQKRTVRVLMVGIVPAGAAMSGAYAAAATLGEEITGSDALGGLAAACVAVGGAFTTVPLARLMARRGRRIGIRNVFMLGVIGAFLSFLSAALDFYPLLILGMIGIGAGQTGSLASRYAAADLATERNRAQAIGIVLWAGAWGSAVGPTLGLGFGGSVAELIGLPELAGPYMLSMLLFLAAALFTDRMLRPDPLEMSGGMTGEAAGRGSMMRALATVWSIGDARLAAAAMIAGHAVMVGIMTATPLHMKNGEHEIRIVGFVISLHIIGMYFFAPIVGKLVDVFGPKLVIGVGGGILFTGAEFAAHTEAQDSRGVFAGLFLIGIGWSFGVVAASTLLTASVPLEKRVEVQGTADLLMVGAGASAGLTSGIVIEQFGYHDLSHNAGLIGVALSVLAVMSMLKRSKQPASKAPDSDL